MKKDKCPKCGYENKRDAVYCGLCYEPLRRRQAGPGPAPAGRPLLDVPPPGPRRRTPPRPLPLPIKIGLVLLGMAGVAYLFPSIPAVRPGHRQADRFADRTEAADRLLEGLTFSKEKLLADIPASPDPAGFGLDGQYTVRLMKLEDDYDRAVEALGLPCDGCVDKDKDAAYLAWAADHRRRENEAAENFSRRYQQLIQRAQAGR